MINDNNLVSGVAIGNRMDMVFDADFGGTDDLELVVDGSIVVSAPQLSAGDDTIQFKDFALKKAFANKITRAEFDARPSYVVNQKLDPASFDLDVKVDNSAVGLVPENVVGPISVELVSIKLAPPGPSGTPRAVTIVLSTLGLYQAAIGVSLSTAGANGRNDLISVKATMISPGAPDVTKLN
jgi:hypothetical protein